MIPHTAKSITFFYNMQKLSLRTRLSTYLNHEKIYAYLVICGKVLVGVLIIFIDFIFKYDKALNTIEACEKEPTESKIEHLKVNFYFNLKIFFFRIRKKSKVARNIRKKPIVP